MIEQVDKSINGNNYLIMPFPAMQGWRLQMRLGKLLSQPIKEALSALPKGKLDNLMSGEIDPAMLGGAIGSLMDSLSENDPQGKLVAELLANTSRNGEKLTENKINEVYAVNYDEMFKAIIAVIGANNFFGMASFGLQNALDKVANSPAN